MQWETDWGLRARMALTMVLLGGLYVVFLAILWELFRSLLTVVVLLGASSLAQSFYSDRLALWSMGAERADPSSYPGLHRSIERLSQQAEMNAVFVVPIDRGFVARLARTHPSTEKRVDRLRALERELELA